MVPGQEDQADGEVAAYLSTQGVRYTAARRLVVRALTRAGGPMAAADMHEKLRGRVPLSSLYRTLAVLEGIRVLSKEHDAAGIARYELAEWLTGHHHHLVCGSCGEVRDVAVDPQTETTIARLVERIATASGYRSTGHRIDVEGTCAACRTA
ncbi:MAG: Fur family transcriptional regulator [Actinomycetota bacterium]